MSGQRKLSHVLANSISLKDLFSPEGIPLSSSPKDGFIKEEGEPRTAWECKRRTELYHRMQARAQMMEERHDSVIDSQQVEQSHSNDAYHASQQQRKQRWTRALERAAGCDHRHAACSSGSKTRRISVDVVQMPESGSDNTAQLIEEEDRPADTDEGPSIQSDVSMDGVREADSATSS